MGLLLGLSACGGGGGAGDDDAAGVQPPPLPPPQTGIGAAGGTVQGPNGAKVVIPPGALTTNVEIKVEMVSTGVPALPAGLTAAGQVFAFTPHGTSFAVPVTMTLPFDATSVPAGFVPGFYKTNAQDQWERVGGATVDAGSITAQITSFSFGTTGVERRPPQREWEFTLKTEEVLSFNDFDRPPWEEVTDDERFPPGTIALDGDDATTLEVFSSADGVTFWASAEDVGRAALLQTQGFIKRAADATLEFVITDGLLEARDFNREPSIDECPRGVDSTDTCAPLRAEIEFEARAFNVESELILDRNGLPALDAYDLAVLEGRVGLWSFETPRYGGFTDRIWSTGAFAQLASTATHQHWQLNEQPVLVVDLSQVKLGETFYVSSMVTATAVNERLREAAVRSMIRDPARISGTVMNVTGLELLDSIPQFPPSPPAPPAPCATGPNPAAGVLQFSLPAYDALESFLGRAHVVVTRTQGSTGLVSATFNASGGSAVPDVHYKPVSDTVFFADGDTEPQTMRVDLVQNGVVEPDKTVQVTLSDPGGCATLGAQSSAVLTILDDDTVPTPPTLFSVGGTVTGLTGTGLVLENHTGLFLEITGNGPFTFSQLLSPAGTAYFVRVFNQPRNSSGNQSQTCLVTNGTGTFGTANVTNVVVTCGDL